MGSKQSHLRQLSRTGIAVAAILALSAGPMVAPAVAAVTEITDMGIADTVDDELFFDPAVPEDRIDVAVVDGVVTLSGSVNNLVAKERAVAVARTVRGVRSVVDQIDVAPFWGLSDADIEADVEEALVEDPATEVWEIGVTVEDGRASLTGTVESWQEKQLAEKVAGQVRGVRSIDNDIDVEYAVDRPDPEIQEDISKALRWNPLVEHSTIAVAVEDGAVTLTGTVGSAAEKNEAVFDAWVSGVTSVDASTLEVEGWARDDDLRTAGAVIKDDAQIRAAVEDALFTDPRVAAANVETEVDDGVVTLRGSVTDLRAKRAAANDARNTIGVTGVVNRLKVRGRSGLSDDEIEQRIRGALTRDPFVERYEIGIQVVDREVYLTGSVDSYFEKSRVDTAAAPIPGVDRVHNSVDVETPTRPLVYDPFIGDLSMLDYEWYDYEPVTTFRTDSEIRDAIHSEMWWSPFVDADQVTVIVDEGVATLTGTVDSWSERAAATENAYEGGAVWVDNDLRVE